MSDETTEEARKTPKVSAKDAPVKKKATKKVAAKKAVKKVAKKAAKKAAKKVTKSADDAQGNLPFDAPEPKKVVKKEGKPEQAPAPVKREAREDPSMGEEPVKFGRVPGGGPVQRDDRSQDEPKPERQERREPRGEREDSGERQERTERGERNDRGERSHQGDRGERNVQGERNDRHDRGERSPRNDRNDRGGDADRDDGGRRRKRRRNRRRGDRNEGNNSRNDGNRGDNRNEGNRRDDRRDDRQGRGREDSEVRDRQVVLEGPKVEVDGLLEMAPKGFGFLRLASKKFEQAKDDVFVSPDLVRSHGLRVGVWIHGLTQEGPRGPQLVEITSINGMPPEEARKLPAFEELKAINPSKRISFETTQDRYTTRVVDLMSPVGRGQRGLIVSPPRSGKTTLLLHLAEAGRTA